MTPPFSITAPVSLTLQPNASGTFLITNSGSKSITITDHLGRFSTHAEEFPAASHATATTFSQPWITVSPQNFTLKPGASETVHIASKVPASAQGNHWLSVVWQASAAHPAAGTVHLVGAVASNVKIPLPGVAKAVVNHPLPAPPIVAIHGGGPSMPLLLGGGLGVFLLILGVILVVTHWRRGGRDVAAMVTPPGEAQERLTSAIEAASAGALQRAYWS